LTAISIALIMSPAAYNRGSAKRKSAQNISFASLLVAAAMVPLMISLAIDAYLVAIVIAQSALISAAIAIFVFVLFGGLWFAYPLARSTLWGPP
jgi:hypothetical protein